MQIVRQMGPSGREAIIYSHILIYGIEHGLFGYLPFTHTIGSQHGAGDIYRITNPQWVLPDRPIWKIKRWASLIWNIQGCNTVTIYRLSRTLHCTCEIPLNQYKFNELGNIFQMM